jgi:sulfotransferase
MNKHYFISGLPRSGSTLLSSILRQNPKFATDISDPLHGYIKSITQLTNTAVGMEAAVPINKRKRLMLSLFDEFYRDCPPVRFNTNRGWTADTPLLKDLFPDFKMIVCLRDIPWILDSFERLNSKNPHTIKPLYNHQDLSNVYDRSHMLMGAVSNAAGYVAGPLANVRHSMFCSERDQICYVEYDTLVKDPAGTIRQLYTFLNEPLFSHNFNSVENSYDEFDQQAKIVGLHTVRKKVEFENRSTVLPDDLWNHYSQNTFWKHNFEQIRRKLNWIHSRPIINNNKQL